MRLRRLGLDLLDVAGGPAADRNAPRLHRLRHFPDQFDLQQAVVEGRALHLHIVGEVELALERTCRNAAIDVFALGLVVLAAFDGDDVLLGRDRNLPERKARDRQRNLVAVFREPFDVMML